MCSHVRSSVAHIVVYFPQVARAWLPFLAPSRHPSSPPPLDINCLRSYVLNPAHKWMLSVSSSPRRRRPPFCRLVPLFVLCSEPPGAIRRPPRLFVPQQKPHLPDKWWEGGGRRRGARRRVLIRRALAKSFRSGPRLPQSKKKKAWSGGGAGSCSHVGKVTAGKYSTRTTCAPFCNSRMFVLSWPASPSSADVDRLFFSFTLPRRQPTFLCD